MIVREYLQLLKIIGEEFKLSDYTPEREFISKDYEGNHYLVTSVCRVNGTLIGWAFEKYNGNWRLHYADHYEEFCNHCGDVVLYTKCWHYTDLEP